MTEENTPKANVCRLAILCAITATLVACFAAALYLAATNTLKNNGRWIPTKTSVAIPLFGAEQYWENTQALAKNRLNLGAWHGFQEVLYKYPLIPKELSFRFYLSENAYLVVLFKEHRRGFEGIRFSANNLFETAYLKGLNTGEFTEKKPLQRGLLTADQWYTCRVRFEEESIVVTLQDEQIYTIQTPRRVRRLGFRGGYHNAYVDDVSIGQGHTDEMFHESFGNMRLSMTILPIVLLCIALAHLAPYILARILRRSGRSVLSALLIADITLALFLAGAWFLQVYLFAGRYPEAENDRIQDLEQEFRTVGSDRRRDEIRRMFPTSTAPNTSRVLFVGSSQTWGAGTQTWNGTFPMLIEEHLNKELSPRTDMRYESINTGISGHRSHQLYEFYESGWVDLNPVVTVINLSTNDRDPIRFKESLLKFIALNGEKGIETILVQEANSIEPNPEVRHENHIVIRNVALKQKIRLIAAHQYLRQRHDTGFLWWDTVHPTSYGYQLLAQTIGDAVARALE